MFYIHSQRKNLNGSVINKNIISELTKHNEKEIVKRAVASFWLKKEIDIHDIKIDYYDYLKKDDISKKWLLTAVWKDRNFIHSDNYGFVKQILSTDHLFGKNCSTKTREGIARGLSDGYGYDKNIVPNVLRWHAEEMIEPINDFLIKYIAKNSKYNSDYMTVMKESSESENGRITTLIKSTLKSNEWNNLNRKNKRRYFFMNKQPFIVHGHDNETKLELKNFLQNKLKFNEPIILDEQPSKGMTIIEKFEEFSDKASYVFVLLTPDDNMNDGTFQARQNVMFELGYFVGKFGRKSDKIFILHKGKTNIPSDLLGVIYIDISNGIESAGEKIRKEIESDKVEL
jgi:predicted nucleotide-binding protein